MTIWMSDMVKFKTFPEKPAPKRQELRDAINSIRGYATALSDIEMLLNVAIDIAVKEAMENKADITGGAEHIKSQLPNISDNL